MSKQRDILIELGLEDAIVFDNPDFDSAIIGHTDDGRVAYDFDKMVEHMMETEDIEYEEAVEFIEFNTLRTIPYIHGKAPVVLFNTNEF